MLRAGLDVGGANIKAARSDGRAVSLGFALWKSPDRLPGAIEAALSAVLPFERLAVTLTGELCDCYETRDEGVRHVLESVAAAAGRVSPGVAVDVWRLDGRLVALSDALPPAEGVAAANWLALATWAASRVPGSSGFAIDVGSTTTDLVALGGGAAHPVGRTDTERLASGELVYSGVERTPLCALLREVRHRGRRCRIAAELFATTLDVYLVLGEIAEDPEHYETADGREATVPRARARLARTVCADPAEFTPEDARELARQAASEQMALLRGALSECTGRRQPPPEVAVVSGSGEFLARRLAEAAGISRIVAVSDLEGSGVSRSACAYALTQIKV
ncbi:MAG: H4MPT-linked C1 transfer pathway protein [Planctomycetota bacterium]|nr:H4MPT-linked C1 transfer pathway protein [Planctomycetota bacterium]